MQYIYNANIKQKFNIKSILNNKHLELIHGSKRKSCLKLKKNTWKTMKIEILHSKNGGI